MLRCNCGGEPLLVGANERGGDFTEYYECAACGRKGTLHVSDGEQQLSGCLEA